MPVTPFHVGPALLLGILVFPALYMPGLILGAVIVDIEPFLYLSQGVGAHPHGITHTYLGGAVVGVVLGLILFSLRKIINRLMKPIKLGQKSSIGNIIASSVLGVYSHVLFDSFLYSDVEPLFPLKVNHVHEMFRWNEVYTFCIITLLLGFFAYLYKNR